MPNNRAYKTELDPNNAQRTALMRHAGAARFAYNWGLQRKNEVRILNMLPVPRIKTPTAIDLHRELNRLKKISLSWMYENSKCGPQEALRDLDRAFKNFFRRNAGFPKFKSRKRGIGSFRLTGSIRVFEDHIQLPRIGKIRLKERGYLPVDGVHILSATVSERAGRWFVSLSVEEEVEVPENNGPRVGVDLGISHLATVSDGTTIENPKALERYKRKLGRLQRLASRKERGSQNRKKVNQKVARCHFRIANIRRDATHKATSELARTKSVIGVENLAVKNLMKNHHLAKSLSDASLWEFKRQLKYKSEWYGSEVVEAGRTFPSTKRCSNCGAIKDEMRLSERVYKCEHCGFEADRDLNAALNIETVAASWSETLNAFKRGEFHAARQVSPDEAGTEHHIGGVLNG